MCACTCVGLAWCARARCRPGCPRCESRSLCRALDALARLAAAPADEAAEGGAPAAAADLDAALKELSKWVDVTTVDYVALHASREVAQGRTAGAIKVWASVCTSTHGIRAWCWRLLG